VKSPALSKWLRRLVLTVLALLLVIAGMTELFRPKPTLSLSALEFLLEHLGMMGMTEHFPPEPALTLIALGFLLGCMVLFSLWRFAGNRALRVQALVRDLLLMLVPAAMAVVAYANVTPIWVSRGRIFTDITQVPVTKVGLVFGTSARVAGRENPYFRYRIDAAIKVWNAGKVEILIVSGDNSSRYYNEPDKMRQALIDRGIPANRIVCDPFGLRTLDSVVRAKESFRADSILFISQRFQNERAIYLARANGIAAFGFDARDVDASEGLKTKTREVGARVKMWLDVNFLATRPQHIGDKIELPGRSHPGSY